MSDVLQYYWMADYDKLKMCMVNPKGTTYQNKNKKV